MNSRSRVGIVRVTWVECPRGRGTATGSTTSPRSSTSDPVAATYRSSPTSRDARHRTTRGISVRATFDQFLARLRYDVRGEGVVSTAIAVLIMALIGAAMWAVFSGVFDDAAGRIEDSVSEISAP